MIVDLIDTKKQSKQVNTVTENGTLNPPKVSPAHFMYEAIRYSRRALAVDQMSRILFPREFIGFLWLDG